MFYNPHGFSFLKQARHDINNLLKFLDGATDLGSLSTLAQYDSSKLLGQFLQREPFSDVQCQVLKMQGDLESFAVKSGEQLQKIQGVQNQSKSINLQHKQAEAARRKHSKGSKGLFCGILLFIGIVIALLAVYFATMEELNEHAIVDFALLGIGLGVDIFALVREILNDKMQKRDDAELSKQCEKLVGDLTVINQTVTKFDQSIHLEGDGPKVVENYGTVEDNSQKFYIGKAENSQIGDKNTQVNYQTRGDSNE